MTSRELVIRALSHEPIDRIPRDLWISPQVASNHSDDVAEIEVRYPTDVVRPESPYAPAERSAGKRGAGEQYTDAWGVGWQVSSEGEDIVTERPLGDLRNLGKVSPPLDFLKGVKLGKVNRFCEQTNRFVLAPVAICPLQRLQTLRGPEATRKDLEGGAKGIRALLDMVHAYCEAEIELWAGSQVDGVVLGDDWGAASGLVLPRAVWQDLFRPLYRDYCKALHQHDKMVFFRTTGDVTEILDDIVRLDVDAVHCSFEDMDMAKVARRLRGRTTFWSGSDRPESLTRGTAAEVREAVLRVRRAFDFGSGGLIAQCDWRPDVPIDKIVAFCEQWIVPLPVHA
ncbi:MAG: uroporphyrinogen decarboxylase family protein [Patescibacteria group bacterium]|nr:uroporphyrinogen decarboxylase family protein [Patescibacteria group bacterium]